MKITAVTALYDIGREARDGRRIDHYIDWLNAGLRVPLPFLVFLDPSFNADRIVLKPGDRIVRVPKNELSMFAHRERVKEILATSRALNRKDISFRLADYGMLVMSKIGLMKQAATLSDADHLLWFDAGLSRFLPDLATAEVRRGAAELNGVSILLSTAHYLSQRQRLGRLPHATVGSAMALASSGDFLVARGFAGELEARFRFMVETEWLPEGRWDNEQVALGCLLFRGALPGAKVLYTDDFPLAPTTRWLFGAPFLKRRFELYRWKYLLRDEIRIRRTPAEDCYLPGDFPETRYAEWLKPTRA
jgi:hypothetical protein